MNQTNIDAIKWKAEQLIALAKQVGVVLTVETIPNKPLAMGNFEMQIDVRPAREIYRNKSL